MKHIVSFSGGKDSTLMLILMLEKGMPIDDIIFADTGVEFPETYENIKRIEEYTGKKITVLKSETHTWKTLFFHKKVKGKRIGQINAFPRVIGCRVNTYLKKQPIDKYYKTIKDEVTEYIGIAANEPKRYSRLKSNQKAPLFEWGITEDMVIEELKKRGLHNPYYDVFYRQGCFMCPSMGINGARKLKRYYPELWKELMWYGKQAELHATDKKFAEWIPGWTVAELDERFNRENIAQIVQEIEKE